MATIAFSPTNPKALESTVVVTLTGLTASTAYIGQIGGPPKHTKTVPFTSDGSGNGTFSFVPGDAGSNTVSVIQNNASTTIVTGTITAGGSS